jgi:hypothetical protein
MWRRILQYRMHSQRKVIWARSALPFGFWTLKSNRAFALAKATSVGEIVLTEDRARDYLEG